MRVRGLIIALAALAACESEPPHYTSPPMALEAAMLEPDTILTPPWAERGPTAADIMRVYPDKARRADVNSLVRLPCIVREDMTFDCQPGWEEEPGYGFSEAAIVVSRLFTVKKDNAYGLVPGSKLTLPVRFVLEE